MTSQRFRIFFSLILIIIIFVFFRNISSSFSICIVFFRTHSPSIESNHKSWRVQTENVLNEYSTNFSLAICDFFSNTSFRIRCSFVFVIRNIYSANKKFCLNISNAMMNSISGKLKRDAIESTNSSNTAIGNLTAANVPANNATSVTAITKEFQTPNSIRKIRNGTFHSFPIVNTPTPPSRFRKIVNPFEAGITERLHLPLIDRYVHVAVCAIFFF